MHWNALSLGIFAALLAFSPMGPFWDDREGRLVSDEASTIYASAYHGSLSLAPPSAPLSSGELCVEEGVLRTFGAIYEFFDAHPRGTMDGVCSTSKQSSPSPLIYRKTFTPRIR